MVMTGATDWDHLENTMTIIRLEKLQDQWDRIPAPAMTLSMLAQAKGWKPKKKKTTNTGSAKELAHVLGGL